MSTQPRREPAFEAQSEAYDFYVRGTAFLRDRHAAQAALLLARALRLEPGRNSIREALGRAEFARGRFAAAAGLFVAIVADISDNDYAHYALGRCLTALGRGEEARTHLRLARALDPLSERYARALEESLAGGSK
ncbi:MAG TPA: tetratricopeptide repeat protein [Thermoleophilia bacterium]